MNFLVRFVPPWKKNTCWSGKTCRQWSITKQVNQKQIKFYISFFHRLNVVLQLELPRHFACCVLSKLIVLFPTIYVFGSTFTRTCRSRAFSVSCRHQETLFSNAWGSFVGSARPCWAVLGYMNTAHYMVLKCFITCPQLLTVKAGLTFFLSWGANVNWNCLSSSVIWLLLKMRWDNLVKHYAAGTYQNKILHH